MASQYVESQSLTLNAKIKTAAKDQEVRPGACPCCGSSNKNRLYTVRNIPIQSCVLLETREQALNYPRRDLELVNCRDCGLIRNHIFDANIVEYEAVTEESQHFSGTFNAFAKRLAQEVAEKYDLNGKHVLEIGCGKGDFLVELCSLGACTGLGIDPGFRQERLDAVSAQNDKDTRKLSFISDYFGPGYSHLKADLIMCRHTLEHIAPVADFVKNIRINIGERQDVLVFFETPDAERVLAEGAFWDIYYEHCSYFTRATHALLFRKMGFEVPEIRLDYDDQYIIHYARPSRSPIATSPGEAEELATMQHLADAFPEKVQQVQDHWRSFVRKAYKAGKRVVTWGGGSKSVSFLTTLGLQDEIDRVVDINPFKQGKYLPGTGHQVVSPEALRDIKPDVVIVMNPIYVDEIKKNLNELGLAPDVVAV